MRIHAALAVYIFITCVTWNASAVLRCDSLFTDGKTTARIDFVQVIGDPKPGDRPEFVTAARDPELENRLRQTMSDIDQFVEPNLLNNQEVVILVGDEKTYSSIAYALNLIFLPRNFMKLAERHGTNPQVTQRVLAHEYGHAVLEKNLLSQKDWFQVRADNIQIFKRLKSSKKELELLKLLMPHLLKISTKPQILTKEAEDLERSVDELAINFAEAQRKEKILSAYQELFADTIEALYAEDPRSPFKILHSPQHPEKAAIAIEWRDFAHSFGARAQADWMRALSKSKDKDKEKGNVTDDPYLLMAPARIGLGQRIPWKTLTLEKKQKIVQSLFKAIRAEFKIWLQKEISTPEDVLAFNQSLLSRLDSIQ